MNFKRTRYLFAGLLLLTIFSNNCAHEAPVTESYQACVKDIVRRNYQGFCSSLVRLENSTQTDQMKKHLENLLEIAQNVGSHQAQGANSENSNLIIGMLGSFYGTYLIDRGDSLSGLVICTGGCVLMACSLIKDILGRKTVNDDLKIELAIIKALCKYV